ncbi:MAG TPA: alpha/beta hydrolase family protein [Pyrinomonadaceae bacterium]|nr:alpha/beta hydrolase family protein [Pyrinomonadaceae bacterium]
MRKKQLKSIFGLLLLFIFSFSVSAQQATQQTEKSTTTVQDLKLDSKLMARKMPYKIILPSKYDTEKTKRYGVIYLLHGLTGHYDNWTAKTKIADYAAQYNYIIVTAEGDDGWYSDSVTKANDKYESYIVKELVPEIDKKFRTVANKNNRSIAGLSMGGYGAIKFGLKYPEMFSLVGSFSGALPATGWTDKNSAAWLSKSIMTVFGDAAHETRYSNDIYKIVREMPDTNKKNLPFIYLDCGTEDFLIQPNRDFAALLFEKKIPHEFRQLPGKHDWSYWNSQVQEFLKLSQKFVK